MSTWLDRKKLKHYRRVAKGLREEAKREWLHQGKPHVWYGPTPTLLGKRKYNRWLRAQEGIASILNILPANGAPRLSKEASQDLDAVNAGYKEVIPTYYDENGKPKGSGVYVSNE